MRVHRDIRRTFWGDIFSMPGGDLNVVYLTAGVPIGWHRHQEQDDELFLVSGRLRVKWYSDLPSPFNRVDWELHESNRGPLFIPRNFWHGYEAVDDNTILLQFNGPGKWDGSDEERHPIDAEMPWDAPR